MNHPESNSENHKNYARIVNPLPSYSYTDLCDNLNQLKHHYSSMLTTDFIGTSVMGKKLYRICLGNGPRKVHFNGSFHANEWITTVLLMTFIEDSLEAWQGSGMLHHTDVQTLFEEVTLDVVPMVNPDGVELVQEGLAPEHPLYRSLLDYNAGSTEFKDWKANIRGVDLNDQFPAHWDVERKRRSPNSPGPRDYTGPSPMSEPEAIAMVNHTRKHLFDRVIAFHTQGEEIYWNYRGLEPPESKALAERMARISGYRAVELTGSDAGYKDWFIQEFRKPGFTVECGLGKNPLPIEDFCSIYKDVSKLMLEGMKQ